LCFEWGELTGYGSFLLLTFEQLPHKRQLTKRSGRSKRLPNDKSLAETAVQLFFGYSRQLVG
jgi:hypothetical protein